MTAIIVGGGLSGCIVALELLDRGVSDIKIYESSKFLGGIRCDYETPHGLYYQGCQYIAPEGIVRKHLKKFDHIGIIDFHHTYQSFNNLFNKNIISNDFAQIVVPFEREKITLRQQLTNNLKDRLTSYEKEVSNPIITWASRFGDLEKLDYNNAHWMQIGRIFYENSVGAALEEKNQSSTSDHLLGIPRSILRATEKTEKALLPKSGYNEWFIKTETYLKQKGVEIFYGTPVKPVLSDNKISLYSRKEKINYSIFAWCANPTPLIKNITGEKLDSPKLKCINLYSDISPPLYKEPHYCQIFDNDSPFLRIFTYSINGQYKISIECLDIGNNLKELKFLLNATLDKLGWGVNVDNLYGFTYVRYTLLTNNDKHRIEQLTKKSKKMRMITGAWETYGTEGKLRHIISQIDHMGALI